jgi:hypothetical protein
MLKPVLALTLLLAGALALGAADEKPSAKPDRATVAKLIELLSSDDFATREKATQELSKLDQVPDLLRGAEKSADAEVRVRAQSAVQAITSRAEEKAFKAMVADLQKVEVDRLVRRMVTGSELPGEKDWEVVQKLTKAVTARANELGGRQYKVADPDMKKLTQQRGIAAGEYAIDRKRLLLSDPKTRMTSVAGCVVLSAGDMPQVTGITDSIVIVDGDFTRATALLNCLLIVRGRVGRVTRVSNSIVLATGECAGVTGCDESFYQVANQTMRCTSSRNNTYVKTVLQFPSRDGSDRVLDTERGPLQLLKFSEKKDN